MSYYHVIMEVHESLGKDNELREITLFDITDIQALIPTIIRPYLLNTVLELDGEMLPAEQIDLFSIYSTLLPIQQLIEQEQKELPSHTDVTITAHEIFHDRDLSQEVTHVVFDLLDD